MNKNKYKELLSLRYSQEVMLFNMIKLLRNENKGISVRDIINNYCKIPLKREIYILNKWADKGWYDYGVSLDLGWLTVKEYPL